MCPSPTPTTTTLLRQDLQHHCLTERPVPTTMHLSLLAPVGYYQICCVLAIFHRNHRAPVCLLDTHNVALGHVCWAPLSPAPTESLKHLKLSKQPSFLSKSRQQCHSSIMLNFLKGLYTLLLIWPIADSLNQIRFLL